MKKMIPVVFTVIVLLLQSSFAQKVQWKRSEATESPLELFHSTHVINLLTAETLQKGDFEFDISHRFVPPINEGYRAFWGLDGPANIRLALAYAPVEKLVITLGRSNVTNNLDLQLRYQAIQITGGILPVLGSVNFGAAWNSYVGDRSNSDSRNFQYYAQFIVNTLLFDKFGFGVVPSYLYNSAIFNEENKRSITMGTYLQYYMTTFWSIMVEWNPTVHGWRDSYNSLSFGLELNTGGHFFKLFVTNNININIAQYLAGADKKFGKDSIRLGFLITRLL